MSRKTLVNVIISFLSLTIVSGSLAFFLSRVSLQAKELDSQIDILVARETQRDKLQNLVKKAEETTNDRSVVNSYFLERESDSIDFLNLVENLAPESGVILNTKSLDQVEAKGKVWVEASFSIEGTEFAVDNFIKVFEQLPYVSEMVSVDLGLKSGSIWKAEVVMRVQIFAYDK